MAKFYVTERKQRQLNSFDRQMKFVSMNRNFNRSYQKKFHRNPNLFLSTLAKFFNVFRMPVYKQDLW